MIGMLSSSIVDISSIFLSIDLSVFQEYCCTLRKALEELNLSSVALGTLSSFQVLLLNTAQDILEHPASSPVKGLSGSVEWV
jgi:hypothetical protein